ncbi:MAG TPA: two-component system response regulator RppA [Halomicronema sp.]
MRVLLVEDEVDMGKAIKQALHQEKYVVDLVFNGLEAWEYLDSKWAQYTLAIFDWSLPGMSGLELCKKIRKSGNCLPVLMLTAKDRMEDKVMGLDAGADDYLVKPFGMEELLARLRALQRRFPNIENQQIVVGNVILDYATRSVYYIDLNNYKHQIFLSKKPFLILEYLMKHPNQILTTEQIRYQLWEVNSDVVSNVVAAQIRLLRRELAAVGCPNLIETIYGTGYRLNLS